MKIERGFNPDISSPATVFLHRSYTDGTSLFGALELHHRSTDELNDQRGRYGRIRTPDSQTHWVNPLSDFESLEELFMNTYGGFMISARMKDLAGERVNVDRFLRHTTTHPLAGKLGELALLYDRPEQIEDPEKPLAAFNHARTVIGLLQARSVLSNQAFECMLDDLGLRHATKGDMELDKFLDTISDDRIHPSSFARATWTGTGSTESIVSTLIELASISRKALFAPQHLSAQDIMKGSQFFTLGSGLLKTALAGHNLTVQEELADEIDSWLGAQDVWGE